MRRPALWIRDACVELHVASDMTASAPLETACDLAAAGDAALGLLDDANISAIDVVLSSWQAYTHEITLAVRRPAPDMLRYAFEEFVPIDIESLTCAFARGSADRWLAIAVETEPVRSLLERIDERGIAIETITLDVVATLNALGVERLALVDDRHVAFAQRSPAGLQRLAITRLSHSAGRDLDALIDASLARFEEQRDAWTIHRLGADPAPDAPEKGAASAIDLNLATDALAVGTTALRPLRAGRDGLALACLALLLVTGGLWLQRSQDRQALAQVRAWEAGLFTELYPGEDLPRSVSLRLRSERKRLANPTAEPGAGPALDPLATLRAIVLAIPRDTRIQIEQIQIEPRDVILRGAARDHGQAEVFARGIDAIQTLTCPAPRTERLPERGVQFFAHAKAAESEAPDGQ